MRIPKSRIFIILVPWMTICMAFFSVFGFSSLVGASANETEQKEYTVYFLLDGPGGEMLEQTGTKGTRIEFPELEERVGFTFLGWIDVYGRAAPATIPKKDIALYANWQAVQYSVTVIDEYGGKYTEPFDATYNFSMKWILDTYYLPENTAEYAYSWDKTLPDVFPLKDVTYEIVKTPIEYTISFENVDGVPSIPFTVETIEEVVFPEVPQREHYIGCWDKTEDELTLADTTITAVYAPIEYTITFENADGIPPVRFTAETKDEIVFPPVPFKKGFKGEWDTTPENLQTENTTVTAIYTKMSFVERWESGQEGCNAVCNEIALLLPLTALLLLKKKR